MNLRQLITEYIQFAFSENELRDKFFIGVSELDDISDEDLLEIYDLTLLIYEP